MTSSMIRLIERRCLRREAFTPHHRQRFLTWMKRMDQVWDVTKTAAAANASNVAQAAAAAAVAATNMANEFNKQKYERRYSQ